MFIPVGELGVTERYQSYLTAWFKSSFEVMPWLLGRVHDGTVSELFDSLVQE